MTRSHRVSFGLFTPLRWLSAARHAHRRKTLTGFSSAGPSPGEEMTRRGKPHHGHLHKEVHSSISPRGSIPLIRSREPPREAVCFLRLREKHAIRSYTSSLETPNISHRPLHVPIIPFPQRQSREHVPVPRTRAQGRASTTPKGAGARAPAPFQGSLQLK